MAADLAARAARRTVLAARLGAARTTRPHRLPDDDRGRLGRRLPQQHLPDWWRRCAARRAAPAARRTLGARDPTSALPGPRIDLVPRWSPGGTAGCGATAAPTRGRVVDCSELDPLRPHVDPARARPRRDAGRLDAARTGRPARSSPRSGPLEAREPYAVGRTSARPPGSTAPATCRGGRAWTSGSTTRVVDLGVAGRSSAILGQPVVRLRLSATPRSPTARSSSATSSPTAPRHWSPAALSTSPTGTDTPSREPAGAGRGVRRRGGARRLRLQLRRRAAAAAVARRLRLAQHGGAARAGELTVHGGSLMLPGWTGPSPYPPPELRPGAETVDRGRRPASPGGSTATCSRRRTTCAVDHGSTYAAPYDASADRALRRRGERRRADIRTGRRRPWRSTPSSWPEATVSTSATSSSWPVRTPTTSPSHSPRRRATSWLRSAAGTRRCRATSPSRDRARMSGRRARTSGRQARSVRST